MNRDIETAARLLEQQIWNFPSDQLRQVEQLLTAWAQPVNCFVPEVFVELSDETLALAAQKGFFRQMAVEEWVVARYERWLLRWFTSRHDPETAWDLVQTVYFNLWKSLDSPTYDPCLAFFPWLRTVAANTHVDHVRRTSRRTTVELIDFQAKTVEPIHEAIANETQDRIDSAFQELSERDRQVLGAHVQGKTPADIANQFGLERRDVHRIVFRARRRLAQRSGIDQ